MKYRWSKQFYLLNCCYTQQVLDSRMKMKNYEKYLDGILLITWSPPSIGNTSLTVILLFVIICGVPGVWGWLVPGWGLLVPPYVTAPFKKVLCFFIAGISFEGVGGGRFLKYFKSLRAEIENMLWQSIMQDALNYRILQSQVHDF